MELVALLVCPRLVVSQFEPPHVKTNIMTVRPAKTQISPSIRAVWSESSLSAWRRLESLATNWVHSEDSDQTGRMPTLIWVFAGRTLILLVLSWGGSFTTHPLITGEGLRSFIMALPEEVFIVFFNHQMSQLMRLWHFLSSVNSFFKRACAAIQWG